MTRLKVTVSFSALQDTYFDLVASRRDLQRALAMYGGKISTL
jgi:hypothetical protein